MEALRTDWRSAELSPRQRAILAYCETLTTRSAGLTEAEISDLREAGLGDPEVLAVVMLAGFFQMATTVADALGIRLDPQLTRGRPEYEAFMES